MSPTLLSAAGLGLLIGLRHAFEPDHLAAVSTLATRHGRLRDGARLGLAWGLGHTATVGVVALLVVVAGFHVPAAFSSVAELLVAALLVLLGLPVVVRYARGRWHLHVHSHDGEPHLHLHSHAGSGGGARSHTHAHPSWDARRSLGLGLAHGLAGSAAIVVLLVATAQTLGTQLAYLAAFGAGSTLAMLAVAFALSLAVRVAGGGDERGESRGARLATMLHVGAAGTSVAVGLLLAGRTISDWVTR